MGKHRERENDFDYEDGEAMQALFGDLDMDDDAFFDSFQPKKTRQRGKRARNARRRIEEYREDRLLAERLREFYDPLDEYY